MVYASIYCRVFLGIFPGVGKTIITPLTACTHASNSLATHYLQAAGVDIFPQT